MSLPELPWIAAARKYIGVKETPGPASTPVIVGWLNKLKAWWSDDSVPWCGVFVANCLREADIMPPKEWMRATEYLSMLVKLDRPAYGCIVVFTRKGGGHVGFVVGRDKAGNLMVLGGNQGDAVNIKPFARDRVAGFRWPSRLPDPGRYNLPVLDSDGKLSENEA